MFTAPFKDEIIEYPMWCRSIWDWARELIMEPRLAPHFRWHSERHFRYDEEDGKFKRIITEPYTADAWWTIQVIWIISPITSVNTLQTDYQLRLQDSLPEDGVPFCIVLYADKTKLSSLGTQQGYPVYARCGNLPSKIRNGGGISGARCVGWLPIVCSMSQNHV